MIDWNWNPVSSSKADAQNVFAQTLLSHVGETVAAVMTKHLAVLGPTPVTNAEQIDLVFRIMQNVDCDFPNDILIGAHNVVRRALGLEAAETGGPAERFDEARDE